MREIFPAEHAFHFVQLASKRSPYEEFSELRWTASPAAKLYYLKGTRILGAEGAVISPDNRVFADFTMPPGERWMEHACFKRRRIPPVQRLRGWYATIAWPEANAFFHWMVESLPRMALLEDVVATLDGIFVSGPPQKFQVESLAALGVPHAKLIPLDPASHYEPDHLFVPRTYSMYNPPSWMHGWFKRAYSEANGLVDTGLPKRLYVSRADAPHRRMENEQELISELASLGFVSVQLAERPFHEQARLFNAADFIVGPHGAGLSHLLFCRPKTQVLEIVPPRWMAPAFMPLAMSAGCDYKYLVADDSEGLADSRPQFANFRVSLNEVMNQVRDMAKNPQA